MKKNLILCLTGVIGGIFLTVTASASPIVGFGLTTDAIIGGTVINFEAISTDSLPASFPSSSDYLDPRIGARTKIDVGGGLTISGQDTLKDNAPSAIYVTPEIVRTQFDNPAYISDQTEQFNYLKYIGHETFNTSGNFLTNWEKFDYQGVEFQETHTNQFVFEFDQVVDAFAFNFGGIGDWVLSAYDYDDLLIEKLDIGVPAITEISDGQYYGIQASGIKYLTLTDIEQSVSPFGQSDPGNPEYVPLRIGTEWGVIDNVTYGRTVAPVPEPTTMLLFGLGLLGLAGVSRRKQ